jgi:hypothetical protein
MGVLVIWSKDVDTLSFKNFSSSDTIYLKIIISYENVHVLCS